MKQKLTITEADYRQFHDLIFMMLPQVDNRMKEKLSDFSHVLESARMVDSRQIPADIVTVGSKIELEDRDNGEVLEYAVVWPSEADPENGGISVLSPVGMMLYGSKVGTAVNCEIPGGSKTFLIRKMLFQPERDIRPTSA